MEITSISIELVQEGNTLGTTQDYEELTVSFEYQLPGDAPFVVIKTDGWSIDSSDDLKELIDTLSESEGNCRDGVSECK